MIISLLDENQYIPWYFNIILTGLDTYITMQNKFMFALYTVKSRETNLVPRRIQSPSLNSLIRNKNLISICFINSIVISIYMIKWLGICILLTLLNDFCRLIAKRAQSLNRTGATINNTNLPGIRSSIQLVTGLIFPTKKEYSSIVTCW